MKDANLVDINLKRDIQEISNYIQGYIDTTYLSQIRSQIQTHKRQCEETPFAEVQLLEAIVPFVEGEAQDKLSKTIKMITYSKMIENMLPSYGVEKVFDRSDQLEKTPNDLIHEVALVLVLYKAIIWADQHKDS